MKLLTVQRAATRQLAFVVAVISVTLGSLLFPVATQATTGCVSHVYGVGNSGTCVKDIQILANHKLKTKTYYPGATLLATDGIYGSKTKAGIQKIQSVFRISTDGVVGHNTWGALCNSAPTNAPHSIILYAYNLTEYNAWKSANCAAADSWFPYR